MSHNQRPSTQPLPKNPQESSYTWGVDLGQGEDETVVVVQCTACNMVSILPRLQHVAGCVNVPVQIPEEQIKAIFAAVREELGLLGTTDALKSWLKTRDLLADLLRVAQQFHNNTLAIRRQLDLQGREPNELILHDIERILDRDRAVTARLTRSMEVASKELKRSPRDTPGGIVAGSFRISDIWR